MTADAVVAVVLHFRTVGATSECLESLVQAGVGQTVLVDNSEDGGQSLEALLPRIQQFRADGMAVTVVSTGVNMGFALGVNTGIANALSAGANRVLLINSDARLLPDALSLLSAEMAVQGGGVVAPSILRADGTRESGPFYHPTMGVLLQAPRLGAVAFLSGACLLIDGAVAERFPFDVSFFFYGEDVAWCSRLVKAGVPMQRLDSAVVVHAGSGSSRNGSFFYEYHTVRGHWLLASMLLKNPAHYLLGILVRAGTLSARAAIRCGRARSWTPFRALVFATRDVVLARKVSLTPSSAAGSHVPLER